MARVPIKVVPAGTRVFVPVKVLAASEDGISLEMPGGVTHKVRGRFVDAEVTSDGVDPQTRVFICPEGPSNDPFCRG